MLSATKMIGAALLRAVLTATGPLVGLVLLVTKVLAVLALWGGALALGGANSAPAAAVICVALVLLALVALCRDAWDMLWSVAERA